MVHHRDAELSLRLLRAGWHGLHVDETFGRGIMPLTFEALKGQRYRWCFGGIQILRMHWRSMMPGRQSAANHLHTGQRVLAGRPRGVLHLAVHVAGRGPRFRAALFAKKAAFLRTPKTGEQTKWWEALRSNWAESALALLGFAGIAGSLTKLNQFSGPLLAGMLLFPTLGLAAAPVNSWAARRAALPAWLRDRRTTEYRRDRRAFAAGLATGGAVAVLGVAIAALALLFTGRPPAHTPNLVGPARGSSAPAAPSHSPSPSSSPASSSPGTTSTPTASPSASPSTSPATSSSPTPSTSSPTSATPTPTESSSPP